MALDDELKGKVVIAKADCTGNAHKACKDRGVRSYPVIKMIEGDRGKVYEGVREFEALKAFALRGFPSTEPQETDVDKAAVE